MSAPEQRKPKVLVERHPQHRRISPNGIIGGVREGRLEADLYTESNDFEEILSIATLDFTKVNVKRTLEARIVLDIGIAKMLVEFLQGHINKFEVMQAQAAAGKKGSATGISGTSPSMTGGVG
jgi:hypothetical protein